MSEHNNVETLNKKQLVALVADLQEKVAVLSEGGPSDGTANEPALRARIAELEQQLAGAQQAKAAAEQKLRDADVPGLQRTVADLTRQLAAQEKVVSATTSGVVGTTTDGTQGRVLGGASIDGHAYTPEQLAARPDLLQRLKDKGSSLFQQLT